MVDSDPDPASGCSSTLSLVTSGGPGATITVSRSDSPSSSHHDDLLITVVDDVSIDSRPPQVDKISMHGPAIGAGPKIIEVKCGPLHARMHIEHFLCPGIHQPCIELDGEMISPKEFTVRANKDKQKDWKGSIRIGKSNLRSLMEMRSFDFYNHSLFCSAKCQSRNYITPKSALVHSEKDSASSSSCSTSSDSEKDSSRRSSIEQLLAMQLAAGPPPPTGAAGVKTQFGYGYQPDHCNSISQLVHMQQALNNNNNNNNNNPVKEEVIDVTSTPEVVLPTAEQITGMMRTQPSLFWSQLAHTALLDDVIDLVQQEVDLLRATAKHASPSSPPAKAAETLCRLSLSLQLGEQIAARVRTRQFHQNAVQEMDRKRRLDSFPSTLGEAIKRPCLQFPVEPAPILKLEPPKQSEFVPSSNSAFSMPKPSHHVELLLKLAVLQQMQQQQQTVLPPPPSVPEISFNVQLTEALLKIQANQGAMATVQ